MVHIIKVPHNLSINKKIKRDADGIIIKAVDQNYLVEKLTQSALFQKYDSTNKIKYKSCPRRHADHLLSRGEWRLPILKGVINTPIISLDGTIFNITGYNQETGLIFNYNESDFDQIPENLSIDDARAAMKIIEDVVIEFPFATDTVDKSVALAGILTAIIRPAIKTAPIFAFSAPTMASGKSLLCDVISIIGTGKVASKITYTGNDEEDRKLLITMLEDGDQTICWDNVKHQFGFSALDTAATEASYKGRRLGKNEAIDIDNIITTFLVNGNNLRIRGDTTTRALLCRIDAKVPRPGEREFEKEDLREFATTNRNTIVTAGLTVMRAWLTSGKQTQIKVPFGRFEEWDIMVRSPLVWLGYADPYLSRDDIDALDEEREIHRCLLIAWHEQFKSEEKKTSEVIKFATDNRLGKGEALYDALKSLTGDSRKSDIDSRSVGNQLKYFSDRQESGYVLRKSRSNAASVWWKVDKV